MYEKDGEKYFVLDTHTHFWDASPENWVPGAEQYAKGWIECFHAYQGLGPPETHWPIEKFQKYSEEDFVKRHVRGGPRRRGHLPADVLEGVVHERLQHHRERRGAGREVPGPADRQRPLGRPRRRGRAAPARGGRQALRPEGREALHGRVAQRLARLDAQGRRGEAVLREVHRARDHEHPRPQGPDDLAARQGRVRRLGRRPRGDELPGAQLHRRARRPAADRGLLLHGDAGAQRLRRARRRHRRPDARPPALLREGHGRAAVLGRRGQDAVRRRLRDLGAQVAGRGARRLGLPRRDVLGLPGVHDRVEEEDPRDSTPRSSTASRSRRSAGLPDEAGTPAAREDAELVEGAAR